VGPPKKPLQQTGHANEGLCLSFRILPREPAAELWRSASWLVTIIDEPSVRRAITPLRMIFWGGLLCIFDITFTQTTNGRGFKCDILDDTLGAILITVGVFKLSAIAVHGRYSTVMRFVQVVSVLAVLNTICAHFIMPLPPIVHVVLNLFALVTLLAIVAFCIAMRWFCMEGGLSAAAQSWNVTTWLFVLIYLFPLGLLYLVTAVAMALGQSFNINLGPAGLLLLPVFVVPVVHLFVSTSRMKRGAETLVSASPREM
jgi:hypothetical protein